MLLKLPSVRNMMMPCQSCLQNLTLFQAYQVLLLRSATSEAYISVNALVFCKSHLGSFAAGISRAAHSSQGQQSEFSKKAASIGQGIQEASKKLFKLSQLAKAPPGPFDDNAPAIAGIGLSSIFSTC